MIDRRKFSRLRYTLPVTVSPSQATAIAISGLSVQISENGIRVALSSMILVGNSVVVIMTLPTHESELTLQGEVIWVQPSYRYQGRFDTGIRFVFLSDEYKKIINEFIQKAPTLKDKRAVEKPNFFGDILDDVPMPPMTLRENVSRTVVWGALLAVISVCVIWLFSTVAHYIDKINTGM